MIAWLLGAALAADCTAITGATVHTPQGPQSDWTVRWSTTIDAIGADVDTSGCTVVDGKGRELTPGLVAATTHLGIVEIEAEASTRDDSWEGDTVRAAHQVALAYNPRSTAVAVTRAAGITSAVVWPSGGLVSGQAAWMSLGEVTQAEAVVEPSVGVVVSLDGLGSRAAGLTRLRELLEDARQLGRVGAKTRYDGLETLSAGRLDLEVLERVVSGELPLLVAADRAADCEALATFATDQRVRVVIVGGAEAWLVAPQLAAAGVPVVLDPRVYGAGGMDEVHGRADNAPRLVQAGVDIVLTLHETHTARALRTVAGNAVRGGLDHATALDAITRAPARVFGIEDRGALEVGQRADIVLWSGDPLEIATRVDGVWIGGVAQSTRSRMDALTDAWRSLPRVWTPQAE